MVFSVLLVDRPQMAAGPPARGNTFQTHTAPLHRTWHEEAGAHGPVGMPSSQSWESRELGEVALVLPISQMGHMSEALATYVTGLGRPRGAGGPRKISGVLRHLT